MAEATAAWHRSLVEKDVLKIKQWFEYVQPQLSKKFEDRLEEDRRLDESAAQYRDEAAGLTARAKERDLDGEGSLTHEETMYLQQWEKKLDEYRVILQGRRLQTEGSETAFFKSFKIKCAALQQQVHDKTAELAEFLEGHGVPKAAIEAKIAISRDAVREMTEALAKELLPEEVQQVRMFDSFLKQAS